MGISYICNEKMRRNYMLEAIYSKIYTINIIDPYVKDVLVYSKEFSGLKNNVFLLLDKIKKIIVFK
ncbi:hypothetical protein K2F40_12085 [Clostridium sp. CM028]|uniref:hypothetical protein n=1 Tax=unclassified Clostridium TaxID=2614128 RepID=UPI001C0AD87D|nr:MULTISPECIES: hypothetical protein [unclassified Clostridium]MBU3092569.1 hypothetical protein [Clostridium sp. CF011]MBW9146230.1 hypothetical protein [Clostridium sp. CM027]MBW9149702.1 hypothetical protein [Clostridium sp. CM028]UVE39791.1 hypothetical protein KTC92_11165 [Clostridium sp. CM027]WAG68698.1 hypothetical protein LL036_11385 [Clostridium sp. CF011]